MVNKNLSRLLSALLVLAAAAGCVSAQPRVDVTQTLVIRGVTLIDGNGGPPLADAAVVIAGSHIAAVGKSRDIDVPSGAQIEDATGLFLIPGLIDVHAHAIVPTCEATPGGPRFAGFDWTLSERLARALLRFGVTTARSPATPTALGVAIRDSIASGAVVGPRFLVSGEFINGEQMTPAAVKEEIRAQAAAGVDFVKLYSRLAPEAVRAGIEEAHAHGLPVIGHLHRTTWKEGLDAGIDYLTHAAPWTDEMLGPEEQARYRQAREVRGGMRARIDWLEELQVDSPEVGAIIAVLAEKQVPVDPTLVAFDTKFSYDSAAARPVALRYRENPNREAAQGLVAVWDVCGAPTDDWTAEDFHRAEAVWPKLLALVRRYHEGGMLLTAGSDTPNAWVIPGESLHRELELLVDAGISPGDVLQIATRNGAESLQLLEELGTVEPGKRADLVLLTEDPLRNISNTRRIAWIMREGVRYTPQDLSPSLSKPLYQAEKPAYASDSDLVQHEFGKGVLFLTQAPVERASRADTVSIRAVPDSAADVKALFVFNQADPYRWSYQVWSEHPKLVSNVLEFAYEESGLPLDSIDSRGWARVVFGRDPIGEWRRGWIELRSERVAHLLWRDVLPNRSLYFLSPDDNQFYSAPHGSLLDIDLGQNYELIPTRLEGNWLQVRVKTPSTCAAARGEQIQEQTAWIRYVQPDGRLNVWYHARGC